MVLRTSCPGIHVHASQTLHCMNDGARSADANSRAAMGSISDHQRRDVPRHARTVSSGHHAPKATLSSRGSTAPRSSAMFCLAP